MPSTSVLVRISMLGWCAAADIFGVVMQLAQSSVGKTLLSADHVAADAGLRSTDQHLQSLVGQIERRLQAGDAAADHQRHPDEAGVAMRFDSMVRPPFGGHRCSGSAR